ncbi:hypothetical protein AWC38_SpisGene25612, partial [Stylophora pistillata]
ESVEKCEPMMLFSEKMSAAIGSESEERNPADSFKNIMNTVIISQSSLNDGEIDNASKEFSSETRSDASKVDTSSHEMRRQNLLEESPELLFTQKEGYNVLGDSNLAASSMVSLGVDSAQPSSMGEYSDGASDISEVSSVHTSDLSSFDDDDDEGEEAEETKKMTEKRELEDEGDTERESVFQSEQNSDSAPRRRSTRISSRRSTKEGESETSEGETTKEERTSSHKRRHGGKKRKPSSESKKVRSVSDVDKPRRRGRPRKDERRVSGQSVSQFRHSRMRYREDSGATTDRGESDSKESRSTRSQRQIKRTRCYSPSSEGTREVFLPRKRSRDDVNQLSSI